MRALFVSHRCAAVGRCSRPPGAVRPLLTAATASAARPLGQLRHTACIRTAVALVRCSSSGKGSSAGSRGREPTAGTQSSGVSRAPAADAQALRQQPAMELLTPFLQEALRPLLETYAAESLRTARREQLAALEQQTELIRAFVSGLEKQQDVLKQHEQPELPARLVRLLEASCRDPQERGTAPQQHLQADLVRALGDTLDAAVGKHREHVEATQQQQLACIRELLEEQRKQRKEQQRRHKQQQKRQDANWQLLLASSQRQEQLLLKLLERLDTAAPPAATLVHAGGQQEEATAASGPGGSTACEQPAVGAETGTMGTQAQQQCQADETGRPRLLDYVRVREELRLPRSHGGRTWEDVIPAGAEGVVLATAGGGTRLKVWTLTSPSVCGWFERPDMLERVADERDLTSTARRRQPLPYDSQRQGVPVTRFTAAPGVLVRRGYDVASGEDAAAMQSGEVGVVQPSRGLGDTCVVEWASGRQAEYDTGRGNRFQLVHLEMSLTSGAPVVGDIAGDRRAGEGGSEQDWELHGWAQTALTYARTNEMDVRLERGTHWIGPTEGDWKGRAMLPRLSSPEGTVEIWHDDVKCLPASPTAGYSACYSASTAGPFPLVTLYAARQGMSMTFGWLAVSERNRRRGTLMRPVEVREDGVVWLMDLQWLIGYPHVKRQVRLLALPVAAGLLPQPGFYDSLHHWSDPVWSDQLYADE